MRPCARIRVGYWPLTSKASANCPASADAIEVSR